MKKKVIIWSGIALIAGVGVYFLVKRFRKPSDSSSDAGAVNNPPAESPGDAPAGPSGNTPKPPAELDTKDKVLAFQQWVINTKKDKTILGSGGASGYGDDGIWKSGGKTDAAWTKYGAEYKSSGGSSGSGSDAALEKAINLILAKASNSQGKANRSYLTKSDTSPDFVKTWAWNLDNDRKAFTWYKSVYRTKNGQVLLNYNPIDVNHLTKSGGIYAYKLPNLSSGKTGVGGDKNIGKVKAVTFDGTNLWFYAPESGGDHKWALASSLKKQ